MPIARRGWLGSPRLRTGERGHRQATWFELFYDLAFVVIVGQISLLVVEDPGWPGIGRAALLFVPVWWAWVAEVFYTTRFDTDTDRAKRLTGTLQLIALTLLAASIARGGLADLRTIAGAYALVRTLQLVEIWRAGRYLPQARVLTRHFLFGYGLGIALWWVGVALPLRWGAWLWGIGFVVEVLTYFLGVRYNRQYPPHVSHVPERHGLFTILVLGESFVGAAAGAATQLASWSAATMVALAVASAAAMWWIYFDRIDVEAIAALSKPDTASQLPFVVWLFAHMPIAFGLALNGAGVDLLLHEQTEHSLPGGLVLIIGQVMFVLAEAVICATSVGAGPPLLRLTHGVTVRVVGALALVIVAVIDWRTGSVLLTLGLSAAVLWSVAVYDFVRGRRVGVIA
jgi:low temperature requirement protein LtrA